MSSSNTDFKRLSTPASSLSLLHCLCHALCVPLTPFFSRKIGEFTGIYGNSQGMSPGRQGMNDPGPAPAAKPLAPPSGGRAVRGGLRPPARCPHKTTFSLQHLLKEPATSPLGAFIPQEQSSGTGGMELGCSTLPHPFAN